MHSYPGTWKCIEDVEEHISMAELDLLINKSRDMNNDVRRFQAAIQGIDLDKSTNTEFDDIKRRAEAKAAGISEEEYELGDMIDFEDEDELE